jgi:hypothetical protein
MRDPRGRSSDNFLRTCGIVALATLSMTIAIGVFVNRVAGGGDVALNPAHVLERQPVLEILALAALAVGALIATMFQYGRGASPPRWFGAVVAFSAVLVALCLGLGLAYFVLTHPG